MTHPELRRLTLIVTNACIKESYLVSENTGLSGLTKRGQLVQSRQNLNGADILLHTEKGS